MTTAKRTDVHSPKNLVTEDYEYLYSWDNEQPGSLVGIAQSDAWREWHAAGPVETVNGVHSSQCTHCGAWLRYVALLRYIPTGQYLYVGETCLDNRFSLATADFQKLRKAAQLDREKQRLLTAWTEYKAAHADVDWDGLYASENGFVANVLLKGRQYGNLSDKQLAAIQQAVVRDAEYAAKKAAAALLPAEVMVAVPEGKLTVTGELLTKKVQDSYYGSVLKCLVKVTTPEGAYKVWGSVAKSLDDAKVGDKVTFTATFERSHDDESFGFFKRPTKASIVAAAV